MTLQEFTSRLQSLCHDGYSMKEVEISCKYGILKVADFNLLLRDKEIVNQVVCVKLEK